MSPQILIGLVFSIFAIIFIINDSKKRDMNKGWAFMGLLGVIGLLIYLVARKPISANADYLTQEQIQPAIENSRIVPDTCPHCKNPNTKKIRLCEWCGNQII